MPTCSTDRTRITCTVVLSLPSISNALATSSRAISSAAFGCAAICAIGLLAAGYSWRRLRDEPPAAQEIGGAPYPSEGRLISFAVCGLMVSGLFTLAILFNTISLWALSTCSQV